MKRLTGVVLGVAVLLGGCAVYATPVPPPVTGIYVPPPVVVAPGPGWGWHWHGGYGGWRHRG